MDVIFEIVSSRFCDEEKKYVIYQLKVEKENLAVSIDRRYTQFNDLYNSLKKEYPLEMAVVDFPKKVIVGNFDLGVIKSRCSGFVSFMNHILKDRRLIEAPCMVNFLQRTELEIAKKEIEMNMYDSALMYLENNFKLLSMFYTDRSHVVLIALCRIVACGARLSDTSSEGSASLAGPTERWATLAIKRFDEVCDPDLLALFAPLLQACIHIYKTIGKDCTSLEDTLKSMKTRGMKVDPSITLMDAILQFEKTHGLQ